MYGKRTNGGMHGSVFTKKQTVEKMLDLVDYVSTKDLSEITLIDPAVGEGAFIIEALQRLYSSSVKFKFDFYSTAIKNITSYEIDKTVSERCKTNLKKLFQDKGIKINVRDLRKLVKEEDFLKAKITADIFIGNPPYVRHENIPEKEKSFYKKTFHAFTHRSDLYICFYEKALLSLNKDGQLCYICSNRWLKNQYGRNLRKLIAENYSFPLILNLEKANAFEENVLAYPAITLVRNQKVKSTQTKFIDLNSLDELLYGKNKQSTIYVSEDGVLSHEIHANASNELTKIEEQGFRIGIGVATGADAVFINREFKTIIEAEVLLPIIQSRDVKSGNLYWSGNFIINPYKADSSDLIDLNKYPRLKRYFQKHKNRLQERHTAKNANGRWYKTIDRIYPELVNQPKLLLPDFGSKQVVYFDNGKYYPHHNLYYITGRNITDLKVLGAILMSEFITHQLHMVGNKMNGGYVRWQSQNLRKLSIPRIEDIPTEIKKQLIDSFTKLKVEKINAILKDRLIETVSTKKKSLIAI